MAKSIGHIKESPVPRRLLHDRILSQSDRLLSVEPTNDACKYPHRVSDVTKQNNPHRVEHQSGISWTESTVTMQFERSLRGKASCEHCRMAPTPVYRSHHVLPTIDQRLDGSSVLPDAVRCVELPLDQSNLPGDGEEETVFHEDFVAFVEEQCRMIRGRRPSILGSPLPDNRLVEEQSPMVRERAPSVLKTPRPDNRLVEEQSRMGRERGPSVLVCPLSRSRLVEEPSQMIREHIPTIPAYQLRSSRLVEERSRIVRGQPPPAVSFPLPRSRFLLPSTLASTSPSAKERCINELKPVRREISMPVQDLNEWKPVRRQSSSLQDWPLLSSFTLSTGVPSRLSSRRNSAPSSTTSSLMGPSNQDHSQQAFA